MRIPVTLSSARVQRLLLLLCVSVPSFMINLDANVVAVSLPAISLSLHADFAAIEWVVSAYTLTFGCLVLPAGTLADRAMGASVFCSSAWASLARRPFYAEWHRPPRC
jgi:MFS family permease